MIKFDELEVVDYYRNRTHVEEIRIIIKYVKKLNMIKNVGCTVYYEFTICLLAIFYSLFQRLSLQNPDSRFHQLVIRQIRVIDTMHCIINKMHIGMAILQCSKAVCWLLQPSSGMV